MKKALILGGLGFLAFLIVLGSTGSPAPITTPQTTVTSTPKPHHTVSKETKRAYKICVQRRVNYIEQVPNTKGNCNDLPLTATQKSKAIDEAAAKVISNGNG